MSVNRWSLRFQSQLYSFELLPEADLQARTGVQEVAWGGDGYLPGVWGGEVRKAAVLWASSPKPSEGWGSWVSPLEDGSQEWLVLWNLGQSRGGQCLQDQTEAGAERCVHWEGEAQGRWPVAPILRRQPLQLGHSRFPWKGLPFNFIYCEIKSAMKCGYNYVISSGNMRFITDVVTDLFRFIEYSTVNGASPVAQW